MPSNANDSVRRVPPNCLADNGCVHARRVCRWCIRKSSRLAVCSKSGSKTDPTWGYAPYTECKAPSYWWSLPELNSGQRYLRLFHQIVERQEVIKRVEKAVQRRKAAEKGNAGHFPRAKPAMNIWGLVIDTMTRAHSIDHMPEVIKTLRNFNNGDRYRTFLFSSANMAGPSGTAPNMGPMFGGKVMVPYWPMRKYMERWMRNPYLVDPKTGEFSESGKESPWLWDHLANEGYVTSHTGFFSDIIGVRTWNASALDHEMPSIVPAKDKNGLCNNHEYDTGSCKGEKTMAQYHMDYSKEFFTKSYKGQRKFSYSHFDEPHHIKKHACQLNKVIPSAIEEVLAAADDMFLIVASDHGSSADATCHQVLLSFTVPTWFLKENPTVEKNLFHNQLQLVSFWDVYQTMKHVASFPARPPVLEWEKGQQSPRGSSMFEKMPLGRTCKQAGVESSVKCVCEGEWSEVTGDGLKQAEAALQLALDKFNAEREALSGEPTTCIKLELDTITAATGRDTVYDVHFRIKGDSYPLFSVMANVGEKEIYDVKQLTTYEPYTTCHDSRLSPALCICVP